MHVAGEPFKTQTGIDISHAPYKGRPPALNDVLGGQVPMMFNNLPAIVELVNAVSCARWRWPIRSAPGSYRTFRLWKRRA